MVVMPVPHAKIIINPAAGAGSTHKRWPGICRLLKDAGLSFEHTFTDGIGHAIELSREAANRGFTRLVSVGGDGTANEVANGILYAEESKQTSLGILSTGTGSDFIRTLSIPNDHSNVCAYLSSPCRKTIDIGVAEFHKDGKNYKRYFINAAGVGFDAAAVEATERFPKYFGGTIPYVAGLLRTLIGYRNKQVVMRFGEKTEKARVLSIAIANGRYIGGGMHIAPEAKIDDKLLDIIIIGDIGKLELLKALPMVYKGTHLTHPKVSMEKTTSLAVESSERLQVYADGEMLGEGPASFSIIPAALNIII